MKKILVLAISFAWLLSNVASATIVADGSFEDQAVGEGLYWEYPDATTPWSYSGIAAIVDGPAMLVTYPVGGNPTAGSTGDQFMGTWGSNVYQTVNLEIGQEYQVSLMAAATGTGAEAVKVHLPGAIDPSTGELWVDGQWGGGWMPYQAINNTWTSGATPTPDEWELHTWNFIAAVDGDQTFYVQGTGQAWVDDVAITAIDVSDIVITAQPQNQIIDDGGTAVFSVTGTNIDNYQWYYSADSNTETPIDDVQLTNGGIVTGADANTLTLTGATIDAGDEGYYYCVVSDNAVDPNTATSNTAALTFNMVGPLELEAHWTLDVDGSDLTGNHDGTFVGTPVSVAGQEGGAFDFAAGEYLSLDTAFDRPGAFTITAWVKTTTGGYGHVFGWANDTGAGATGGGALFRVFNGVLEYGEWDGGTYANITAGSGLNDGQWYHVAVTFDTTAVELFIDGVSVNSGTIATTYGAITTTEVSVGNLGVRDPATHSITGSLDDVRLYDTALGVAEIEDIYYATVEGPICLDPPQGDTNGDCIVDTADLAAFIAEWLD